MINNQASTWTECLSTSIGTNNANTTINQTLGETTLDKIYWISLNEMRQRNSLKIIIRTKKYSRKKNLIHCFKYNLIAAKILKSQKRAPSFMKYHSVQAKTLKFRKCNLLVQDYLKLLKMKVTL
jgi:hypothetical protein